FPSRPRCLGGLRPSAMVLRKRDSQGARHKGVRKTVLLCLRRSVWPALALLLALSAEKAHALILFDRDDLQVRWDNTFRYTAAFRLVPRNGGLVADPNGDDGDRNFDPGVVSNRFDLLSEFDVSYGAFGFHLSAAGWYDTVYHQGNDNDAPSTF